MRAPQPVLTAQITGQQTIAFQCHCDGITYTTTESPLGASREVRRYCSHCGAQARVVVTATPITRILHCIDCDQDLPEGLESCGYGWHQTRVV